MKNDFTADAESTPAWKEHDGGARPALFLRQGGSEKKDPLVLQLRDRSLVIATAGDVGHWHWLHAKGAPEGESLSEVVRWRYASSTDIALANSSSLLITEAAALGKPCVPPAPALGKPPVAFRRGGLTRSAPEGENPAEVARVMAAYLCSGTGLSVDHASFDAAADQLDTHLASLVADGKHLEDILRKTPVTGVLTRRVPSKISADSAPVEPHGEEINPDVRDMSVPGYESLAGVLREAYAQAAIGKGKERHANGLPYDEQPMQDLIRLHGLGFATGQAGKKSSEALGLPTADRQVAELLGAINYLAGAVIAIRAKSKEPSDDGRA